MAVDKKSVLAWVFERIIPVYLFASATAFGWAIRGCAGFGTIRGCVFAGTLIATLWLMLSRDASLVQSRRYALGWLVFAIILGIGIGGMRGWSQWPQWIKGTWQWADYDWNLIATLDPSWGYTWIFIAGSAWAGFGAILIAWTGSKKTLKPHEWLLRVEFGLGAGIGGYAIFHALPSLFLPLHDTLAYDDWNICTECMDSYEDNLVAWIFFCMYCGFLAFEIFRKDWNNVKLISVVGSVTGVSWMALMGFQVDVIWWRVWEASSGAGIGLGFGLAWVMCNKPRPDAEQPMQQAPFSTMPGLEKVLGVYVALALGIGWSTHQAIQGFSDVYLGIDTPTVNLPVLVPVILGTIVIIHYLTSKIDKNPFVPGDKTRNNLKETRIVYLVVYVLFRIYGLMVTGQLDNEWELGFFTFYIIQATIDLVLVFLYWAWLKRAGRVRRLVW